MKKKFLSLVLAFSCLFIGCEGKDENGDSEAANETNTNDAQSDKDDTVDDLSVENQIKIIYDNADVWEITDDDIVYMDDTVAYGYTVADLDKDGFIEVIKAVYQGKNKASTTTIYEVTNDKELAAFDMDGFRNSRFEPNLLLNNMHIIDDSSYMVQATELSPTGFVNDIYYIMNIKDNAVELTELEEFNANKEYENNLIEELTWFEEITEDNIKSSYEKHYIQGEEDELGLYSNFLNNEQKAIMDFDDHETANFEYEDGEELDIETIENRICESESDSYVYVSSSKYVDYGNDGKYELKVDLQCKDNAKGLYSIILKEDDDKLYLRFVRNNTVCSFFNLYDTGFICEPNDLSLDNIPNYKYGYVDKDVRYHMYFCQFQYYSFDENTTVFGTQLDASWEKVDAYRYSFYEDPTGKETYFLLYDWNELGYINDPNSSFRKTFDGAGAKTYSTSEINQILKNRASEIGLDISLIPDDENIFKE